jgi:hypothetical protein
VAKHLSDQEERQEIVRYADDLDLEIAKLDAQIAGQKAAQNAIDAV